MKNKLSDLNDHLFAQMERLSDENINDEQLAKEVTRTKAINSVAKSIVDNASLVLQAHKAVNDGVIKGTPGMIGIEEQK